MRIAKQNFLNKIEKKRKNAILWLKFAKNPILAVMEPLSGHFSRIVALEPLSE
jgi:hypothetical protein